MYDKHYLDCNDNPEGGCTFGNGFCISWQRGPLGRDEGRKDPNGAFVEDIIKAAIARITFYQESKFKSMYNERALTHLEAAVHELNTRTRDRENRQVEGTHSN